MRHIPYWLLKMLPMWDYACPRCKKEVSKNSHKCPHCGERYPFPLRVPPKCLKNKEELERYVHEKVFPKISAWQREYLAQYFTVIFQDGFESGNFSAWTAVEGAPEVTSADKHHGNYSCFIDDVEGPYKDLGASYSELYMRVYFKMTSYPNEQYYRLGIIKIGQSGIYWDEHALFIEAYQPDADASTTCFSLFNGYFSTRSNSDTVTLNQWYCVEVKFSTLGSCILYIDGVQKATLGAYPLQANRVAVGLASGLAYQAKGYIDCVVVADTYIGPEEVPPPVTHILSVSTIPITEVSFALNGVTKTTPYSEALVEGTYTVAMPTEVTIGAEIYRFVRWNDGDLNPTKTVVLTTDISLIAEYELYTPPPTTHQLTVDSTPIRGVPFTIERVS